MVNKPTKSVKTGVVKKAAPAKPAKKPVAPKVVVEPKAATPKAIKKPSHLPVKESAKVSAASKAPMTMPKGVYFYANGKRKTSVASVRLYKDGKGTITINNRTFENYFPVFTDRDKIHSPLRITSNMKSFDIVATVHGGGIHSQAEAVRHGIAKALLEVDANVRSSLKTPGFLTRDSRVKERKKYGLKRARRAPQFSKR